MYGIEFSTPEIIITTAGVAISFVGGAVTGVKGWWSRKSKDQKARAIADGIEIISDGRVTSDEITRYIKEHL